MYAVEVSDQIMIAHSFRGEVFGPAQGVHGATFVIRVAFLAEELDAHGIVVDIARAHDVLKEALVPLNYHNLDELPQFKGINTTTEFLTRHLFDHLADAARIVDGAFATDDDWGTLVWLAMTTGMRRGESARCAGHGLIWTSASWTCEGATACVMASASRRTPRPTGCAGSRSTARPWPC